MTENVHFKQRDAHHSLKATTNIYIYKRWRDREEEFKDIEIYTDENRGVWGGGGKGRGSSWIVIHCINHEWSWILLMLKIYTLIYIYTVDVCICNEGWREGDLFFAIIIISSSSSSTLGNQTVII